MSALLVERDPAAYKKLAQIPPRFPDVSIHVYPADFLTVLPTILKDIPANAFAFFLVDPRGWRIRLRALNEMLARPSSEIVFNFMFDFINRAAGITDPAIATLRKQQSCDRSKIDLFTACSTRHVTPRASKCFGIVKSKL